MESSERVVSLAEHLDGLSTAGTPWTTNSAIEPSEEGAPHGTTIVAASGGSVLSGRSNRPVGI